MVWHLKRERVLRKHCHFERQILMIFIHFPITKSQLHLSSRELSQTAMLCKPATLVVFLCLSGVLADEHAAKKGVGKAEDQAEQVSRDFMNLLTRFFHFEADVDELHSYVATDFILCEDIFEDCVEGAYDFVAFYDGVWLSRNKIPIAFWLIL